MYQKISDQLNKHITENGGRITVVFMSDFGATATVFFNAENCEVKGYAQYKSGIRIIGKKKGGRNLCALHFYGDLHHQKSFAVFSGWRETEDMPDSFMCFDKSIFYRIVDSVPEEYKLCEVSERMMPINEADPFFRVVVDGFEVLEYNTLPDLFKAHEHLGFLCDTVRRRELQGMPYLKGLCGPMWDGMENGRPVIRYESTAVYDALSW